MYKKTINLGGYFIMNVFLCHVQGEKHKTRNHGGLNRNILDMTKISESNNMITHFIL